MGVGIAVCAAARTAAAGDPPPRTCASMLGDAHEQQSAGHLREARGLLLQCAKPACRGEVQKKCARAASRLSKRIAWIAPVVTDASGEPKVDAQVAMDGQPLTGWTEGHMMPVDPGMHEFSVAARVGRWPGRAVSATRTVMIVEGQHGPLNLALPPPDGDAKVVDASYPTPGGDPGGDGDARGAQDDDASGDKASPGPARVPSRGGGPSALAYVFGGAGLLGLGAGALLTYWGKTDNDALAQCTPNCQSSSVSHVQTMYLAADISFGAGAALLGVATFMFATSHGGEKPAPATTATRLDLAPTPSGAMATVTGAF